MIKCIKPVLLFLCSVAIASCEVQRKCNSCGIVTHGFRDYNLSSHDLTLPQYQRDWKVWYWDSCVIQEAATVYINEDANNIETWHTGVQYYTYIDLRSRSFYRYSSFSDTARMIKCCYTQADSTEVGGGWNFYYHPAPQKKKEISFIADTIIEGVSYKRAIDVKNNHNSFEESKFSRTLYFDCSRKGSMFTIDYNLSQIANCPLVRIDYFPNDKKEDLMPMSLIEFVSDSLSKSEIDVFKAWKKNAEKFPVKAQL